MGTLEAESPKIVILTAIHRPIVNGMASGAITATSAIMCIKMACFTLVGSAHELVLEVAAAAINITMTSHQWVLSLLIVIKFREG